MMIFAAFLGGVGLIVGSFLALVSVRLPLDEEVVMTSSHCRSCQTRLGPWQLIPVLSWIGSRGRCASCRARISPRYPLIELAAGAIGVWAGLSSPDLVMVALTAVLGWQLLLIAVVDAEHFWLPDILTWPLAITGLAAAAWVTQGLPWLQVIGLVAGFVSLWALARLYRMVRGREGLGGGDPFLFAGAGAWVGLFGLPSVLLYACVGGFAVVAARLIVRRAVASTDRLPLGTFLAMGIWLTWLYGPLGVMVGA